MKKTAVVLAAVLILTSLGGMSIVSAAEQVASFDVSATAPTVIHGDQYTSTGIPGDVSGYFTQAAGVRYFYCLSSTVNNGAYSWSWASYDLNVAQTGMYKITVSASSSNDAQTEGGTMLALRRKAHDPANVPASGERCTITHTTANVPRTAGPLTFKTFDMGVIDLSEGINTIGIKNIGDYRANIRDITITPVEAGDPVVITRTVRDWKEKSINAGEGVTNDDGLANIGFHGSTHNYHTYEINAPQAGSYMLSFGYSSSAAYKPKISVFVDSVAILSSIELSRTSLSGKAFQFNNVGILNLTQGLHDIKIEMVYADIYTAGITLEKISDSAGAYVPAGGVVISSGTSEVVNPKTVEFTYNVTAQAAGEYALYMNLGMPAMCSLLKINLYVNGEEQCYTEKFDPGATGWDNYHYVDVGTVKLPKGASAIKIKSTGGSYVEEGATKYYGYFFFKNFKLEMASTIISADSYTDSAPEFTNILVDGSPAVRLQKGQTANYTVSVLNPGLYSVKLFGSSKTVNNALTVLFGEKAVTANINNSLSRLNSLVNSGYLYLPAGESAFSVTLNDGISMDIKSIIISEPSIKLYSGSVAAANEVMQITDGTMIAQADLKGVLSGKDAIYAFAVYEGNMLKYINYSTPQISDNTTLTAAISGILLDDSKTYSAKVFVWDGMSGGTCKIY